MLTYVRCPSRRLEELVLRTHSMSYIAVVVSCGIELVCQHSQGYSWYKGSSGLRTHFFVLRANSTSARKCLGRGNGSGGGIASSVDFTTFIFFLLGLVLILREVLALGLELGVDAGLTELSNSSPESSELKRCRRFRHCVGGRSSSSSTHASTLYARTTVTL